MHYTPGFMTLGGLVCVAGTQEGEKLFPLARYLLDAAGALFGTYLTVVVLVSAYGIVLRSGRSRARAKRVAAGPLSSCGAAILGTTAPPRHLRAFHASNHPLRGFRSRETGEAAASPVETGLSGRPSPLHDSSGTHEFSPARETPVDRAIALPHPSRSPSEDASS
jgi:hypothetical protein